MVNKPDVSDVRKLKSIVVASDIASCLNLRVQSGCRVLNLLDQAGHVLEEEVVKVLLLHVLELEHGLAGGLGGHGDGVADCGGLAVLCYGGRDRLPDTDTGLCPGTIRADPRL